MAYITPDVGPAWFSSLFYAGLAAYIRAMELVYQLLDLLLGWAYAEQ